jgi:hypothetical protein
MLSKRDQELLYVGGEGGVGKSQIIKAIVAGRDLIRRKEEVILMAPTGAPADNSVGHENRQNTEDNGELASESCGRGRRS